MLNECGAIFAVLKVMIRRPIETSTALGVKYAEVPVLKAGRSDTIIK
jgi:hypothetical protein